MTQDVKGDDSLKEFHRKHRPRSLKTLVGQPEIVKILSGMIDSDRVPHAILLTGPSGCGKTTVGRILQKHLNCHDNDFHEINCADERGIELARSVGSRCRLKGMSGGNIVYLLDEAHRLTPDAQSALLKTLEDPPKHAYFQLATTDPQKLLATVKTRCTELRLKPLNRADAESLLARIAGKEGVGLSEELVARIYGVSEGSPRMMVNLLNKVAGLEGDEERLNAILSTGVKAQAFEVVRLLLWKRGKWEEIARIIESLEENGEDWEGVRRLIVANAANEMLKAGKSRDRAFRVAVLFGDPWYDCGKARMVTNCYDLFFGK